MKLYRNHRRRNSALEKYRGDEAPFDEKTRFAAPTHGSPTFQQHSRFRHFGDHSASNLLFTLPSAHEKRSLTLRVFAIAKT
jgi:hypothetical protein